MKYIKCLERISFLNLGWIEIWDYSKANSCEEARIEAANNISGTVFEKYKANNPLKRYEQSKNEAVFNSANRPLEFIPMLFTKQEFFNNINFIECNKTFNETIKFITLSDDFVLTNLRNILKYDKSNNTNFSNNYNEIIDGYIVFKLNIPMFLRDQIITHTQLSKVNKSNRVGKQNDTYYLPNDILCKYNSEHKDNYVIKDLDSLIDRFVNELSPNSVKDLLKSLGYNKEIWTRWPNQMKYGVMSLGGWIQDRNGFKNLLLERSAIPEQWKNWTQVETKNVCINIKDLIDKYYPELFDKYILK